MKEYKVEKLSKEATKAGYVGMNKFAAKSLHFPWRHKKKGEHVVEVKPGYTENYHLDIIHHEETEEYFMKNKHYPYKKAHKLALKFEKEHMPFPRKNVKKVMQKIGLEKK